jgi:hypothetical protein
MSCLFWKHRQNIEIESKKKSQHCIYIWHHVNSLIEPQLFWSK